MQFLGTAAADCIPCPFCDCEICEQARQDPKLLRFRSMFLLDDKNLIDCNPELHAATIRFGLNLSQVETVFVTHTHEDHFCPSNSMLLSLSRTRRDVPIHVFLSEAGYAAVMRLYELVKKDFSHMDAVRDYEAGRVILHPVKVGVPFEHGGYRVMAVEGRHRVSESELAINYLFEKDGKKFLYACDTGVYMPESMELLRGKQIDVLVMECTNDDGPVEKAYSHMNLAGFAHMVDWMLEVEAIRPDTRIYATHMAHKRTMSMAETQAWLDENVRLPVTMAWDGLKIE